SSYKSLAFSVGFKVEKFVPDILLVGGETLNIAGISVEVIHTPGHSAGGVCYVVQNNIFVGDTLFKLSYGRTDLYDGSFSKLKNAVVNKLFNLKNDYTLYTGHGEPTTLAYEKINNPILFDFS
ncbi:MAG: MBL fold metallo-hydrolase, partial [Clostridia bacterium]